MIFFKNTLFCPWHLFLVFMFGSENIFFAPLKIMTNQKSPAHFWARFSGHVVRRSVGSVGSVGHEK
jgi:hypothetical protein